MATYLSFDIGGTDIKFGVLNEHGHILEQGKVQTESSGEQIIQTIVDIKEQWSTRYTFDGAAFSLPGFVDVNTGYLKTGGAIDDFYGFQFKEVMVEKLSLPVELENDVNCVALAEKWLGKAQSVDNFICITIGTGIGGAIYINNQMVRGHGFMAGEFGYMFTKNIFDTEDKATATMSFTASVREGLRRRYSKLKNINSIEHLSGKDIFKLAESGDNIAINIIDDFYKNIAIGLYNLTFILNPEKIIIGGAISNRDDLISNIENKFEEIIQTQPSINKFNVKELVTIEKSTFNNDSGLIGSVYHFLSMTNQIK
ncbi:ROK family protein [Aliivibrio logei]|uniref:Glucokinase n=1 Tax=Aliivibrio logei 5S-186 TaxID=626086 RepID=A0ABX3APY5_ALILO|nr:ROK family protein [Aliivibrio logei]OEF09883.1 glucokinase [Aliivibrio logei 5S-186]